MNDSGLAHKVKLYKSYVPNVQSNAIMECHIEMLTSMSHLNMVSPGSNSVVYINEYGIYVYRLGQEIKYLKLL